MSNVLKISEGASLALHAMVLMAGNSRKTLSTRKISARLNVSEAHLSKVLQRLAKVGLVKSAGGRNGGFMLHRPPHKISLLAVYEAIEGPLQPVTCLLGHPICNGKKCIIGDVLRSAHKQFKQHFGRTRLSDLSEAISE